MFRELDFEEQDVLVGKDDSFGFAVVGAMAIQSTIRHLDKVEAKSISRVLKAITICINNFIQLEQELRAANLIKNQTIYQSNS